MPSLYYIPEETASSDAGVFDLSRAQWSFDAPSILKKQWFSSLRRQKQSWTGKKESYRWTMPGLQRGASCSYRYTDILASYFRSKAVLCFPSILNIGSMHSALLMPPKGRGQILPSIQPQPTSNAKDAMMSSSRCIVIRERYGDCFPDPAIEI